MKNWIREIILGVVILLLSGNATMLYNVSQDLKTNTVLIEQLKEDLQDVEDSVDSVEEDMDDMHDWRAATSASRFTSTDGKDVWNEIRSIQLDIAVIRSEMGNHFEETHEK